LKKREGCRSRRNPFEIFPFLSFCLVFEKGRKQREEKKRKEHVVFREWGPRIEIYKGEFVNPNPSTLALSISVPRTVALWLCCASNILCTLCLFLKSVSGEDFFLLFKSDNFHLYDYTIIRNIFITDYKYLKLYSFPPIKSSPSEKNYLNIIILVF